ncbi:MAG: SusD/RagB family nutrient-binding outer membrane lipoprotein [Bacteroidales bacterium]
MKKLYKQILWGFLSASLFSLSSCGDKFDLKPWEIIDDAQDQGNEEEGVNKGDVTLDVLEGELLQGLPYMLLFDAHKYQYARSQNIDVFAGYFTVSKSKFEYGGPLYYTYYYPNTYYEGPIGEATRLYPQLYHAYFFSDNKDKAEWKALAIIAYSYTMHQLVDFYGCIPFDDLRELKETNPMKYQNAKEVYAKILPELSEAVEILKQKQPSADDLKKVEGESGGLSNLDWRNWVKFANSIRLRMALNMVKVNPEMAREVAEAAVNDEIGVFQSGDVDFGLSTLVPATHPLYQISVNWNDCRLGASLENILKRYQNPLLEKWFTKNSATIKSSTGATMLNAQKDWAGIRQSVPMYVITEYAKFSQFNNQYMPRTFLKVTEVLFNRAEGALRGWNMGGTAREFYEAGISRVFADNGCSEYTDSYLEREFPEDVDYNDYYKPEYSLPARVNVGVKWDDEDQNEIKLEKIITQKYIANFPMSADAWTTFRRTGYPRLFPAPEEYGWTYDNSFDVELQIRRLPFSQSANSWGINAPGIIAALNDGIAEHPVQSQSGNTAGTRVWWDVPTETRDENNRVIPNNF